MLYLRIVILFFWGLIACSVFADLPTARESDKRLQSEGKGWRLEKAQIINSKMPRILLIGDSILNGYARQVIKKLNGKAYVDMWVNPYHQSENLNKVLDRKKQSKRFTQELGCTFDELVVHLESQFYSDPKTGEVMTWDNHTMDGWHVDHIKPLHEFDLYDDEQFKKAAHYTNLQPLWWWQNLEKNRGITYKQT